MFHVTSNVNSIVQNVIRINNGTIKHVTVDVKIIVTLQLESYDTYM